MTFTDIFQPFFIDDPQQFPEASRLFLVVARAVSAQAERAKNIAGCVQYDEIGEFHIGLFASAPFSRSVAGELTAFRRSHPDVSSYLRERASPKQI